MSTLKIYPITCFNDLFIFNVYIYNVIQRMTKGVFYESNKQAIFMA
jgi:hypothetical protein